MHFFPDALEIGFRFCQHLLRCLVEIKRRKLSGVVLAAEPPVEWPPDVGCLQPIGKFGNRPQRLAGGAIISNLERDRALLAERVVDEIVVAVVFLDGS